MGTRIEQRILTCSCRSAFQDKRYGLDKRVHNPRYGKSEGQFRCTVCGNVRTPGGS